MNRFRRLPVAVAVAGLLGVAAPATASAISTLTISGATASYPLVQLLAQKYQKLHPHKIKFKIAQGGTTVGINDVLSGRVSIADSSRDPLPAEKGNGLDFYPIAKYPICIVTNNANPLANLTKAQATAIFTGKDKTWGTIPGAGVSGAIEPVSRTSVAGVLTSFQELLLGNTKVSTGVFPEEASEGQVVQKVASSPNAIGFVSGYQADKGTVHAVGFNGVGCTLANAAAGEYEGVSRFYEVTKGKATGAASAFIGWIDVSAAAKKIIETQWIPVS